jgi:hypothetical protein
MGGLSCAPQRPQRPDHALMVLLTLLTLVVMSLSLWLLSPLVHALTPVLSLVWLGWGVLLLGLWLFAAPSGEDPPSHP